MINRAIIAFALLLAGCGNAPSNDIAGPDQRLQIPASTSTPAPEPSPEPSPSPSPSPGSTAAPAAVTPITLKQSDRHVDFTYTIPAAAAAIPSLRAMLMAEAAKGKADSIRDQAQYARDLPPNAKPRPYGLEKKWKIVAETEQLLVLVASGYVYTGGAHGSDTFDSLVWDRAGRRRIAFGDLFTNRTKALETVSKPFCDTLDGQRRKRRGQAMTGDDFFTRCPPFDETVTLTFTNVVGGKFGRLGVYIPADVAGAHAEGNYTFDLVIPKAMIPFVRPEWRASFPG